MSFATAPAIGCRHRPKWLQVIKRARPFRTCGCVWKNWLIFKITTATNMYRTESKGDKRREMRTYIFSTTPWNDSISYSRAQYKMTVREYLHNAWVSCLNKQPKSRLTTTNPASIDCGFVIISPTHGTHALEIAERTRRIQPIPQPPKLWTQIRSKCN